MKFERLPKYRSSYEEKQRRKTSAGAGPAGSCCLSLESILCPPSPCTVSYRANQPELPEIRSHSCERELLDSAVHGYSKTTRARGILLWTSCPSDLECDLISGSLRRSGLLSRKRYVSGSNWVGSASAVPLLISPSCKMSWLRRSGGSAMEDSSMP